MEDKTTAVNLEIERRFLVTMPSMDELDYTSASEIIQTYLLSEDGSTERVRKRSFGDCHTYTHTKKRRINHIVREEVESEINSGQYELLLERTDPQRNAIIKTRYCINYMGKVFELDLFPFWTDRAIVEIELCREDEEFVMPPQITVIREITGDKRYTNASLAMKIPCDPI